MILKTHMILPGGMSLWHEETYTRNSEPHYGGARRDGRFGKAHQRAFYTASGSLVLRYVQIQVQEMTSYTWAVISDNYKIFQILILQI